MKEDPRKIKALNLKIESAEGQIKNIREAQIEYMKFGMRNAMDFYYKLAYISAGTLSFSVTLLSYLSTTTAKLQYTGLLFLSWIGFLGCLLGSLHRNHFHGNFLHYQLQRRFLKSKADMEALGVEMSQKYPETVYNSYDGIDNLINASQSRKKAFLKYMGLNKKKEKLYSLLWVNSVRLAHVGFVVGLLFMAAFAITNLGK